MKPRLSFQLDPDAEYTYHAPAQAPINPPYREACELKKHKQLAQPGAASAQQLRESRAPEVSCAGRERTPLEGDCVVGGDSSSVEHRHFDMEAVEPSGGDGEHSNGDENRSDGEELLGATGVDVEKLSLQES